VSEHFRMRKPSRGFWIALLAAGLVLSGAACRKAEVGPRPPVAAKIGQALAIHGQTRIDDYYWLRERDNPKVVEYLRAENDYLRAVMKPTAPLQEALYKEMAGRLKPTDVSVPYRLRGYYYYTRYEDRKDYPVVCRKKGSLEAPEEIILNENELAAGQPFFSAVGLEVSPDNDLLAYGTDTLSRRLYALHFKNLKRPCPTRYPTPRGLRPGRTTTGPCFTPGRIPQRSDPTASRSTSWPPTRRATGKSSWKTTRRSRRRFRGRNPGST
jgi:hypothetical protein